MMTAAELLKPRFEVIANYPHSPYEVADIIEARATNLSSIVLTKTKHRNEFGDDVIQENYFPPSTFELYPHLFRKLNWWEHRKVEDMPKKLISKAFKDNPEKDDNEIIEIQEWDMEYKIGWIDKQARTCASLLAWNPEYGYFPVD